MNDLNQIGLTGSVESQLVKNRSAGFRANAWGKLLIWKLLIMKMSVWPSANQSHNVLGSLSLNLSLNVYYSGPALQLMTPALTV